MYNDFLALNDLSNEELIQLVQNRNEAAFVELISRWTPRIRGVIATNSRQPRDAQEIHTDIWIAVWQNIRELRNVESFGAWLHRIAYNGCKRYYTLARQSRNEIPHQHSLIVENIDLCAAARYREAQLIRDVKEAIYHLPQKVRSVAELFYLEAWSIKEISEECKLPVGTVKTKLREIRVLLREEFGMNNITGEDMSTKSVTSREPIQIVTDTSKNNLKPAILNVVDKDPSGNTWELPEGAIVRFGKGNIGDVKLLPNNKYFAVGTGLGIWWYDISSMSPISLWDPHKGAVRSFDFSHDGKWITIGTVNEIVKVMDVENGECVMQLEDQDGYWGITCSSDGKWVATDGGDGVVSVFDTHSGIKKAQMDRGKHKWKSNDVWQLEFSPDSKLLAATVGNPKVYSDDEQLLNPDTEGTQTYVWNPETGEPIVKFAGSDYAYSSDSRMLAAASMDETVEDDERVDQCVSVWDLTSGEQIAHFTGHEDWVDAVAISPCGQFVASSSRDGTLRVWDLTNRLQKIECPNFEDPFYGIDGRLYATIFYRTSNTIEVWDVEEKYKVLEISIGIGGYDFAKSLAITYTNILIQEKTQSPSTIQYCGKIPEYHIQPEVDFPWPCPLINWLDDKTLLSNRMCYSIVLWDVTQKCQSNSLMDDKWLYHYEVLTSGNILALEIDGDVKVWDSNNPKDPVLKFTLPSDWTRQKVFDPTGKYLAVGRKDGKIYLWNLIQSEQKVLQTEHTDEIQSLAFSPDGQHLVSGACDNTARVYDLKLGKEIVALPMDKPCSPMTLSYSPCGNLIAGELDDEIRFWCAKDFTTIHTIYQGGVYRRTLPLVFSPCGNYLAAATWWEEGMENLAIRIWDVATGEHVHVFHGHNSLVQSLAFSPNGTMLACGCDNGTILVWDMQPYL
ncbi:sigma-70 family RNA polymerase sigma factor [Candidatus Poribacteria bacterium]|nr:sigma-70 family RNA polymerase sigma factor [Candidatus Poribacteria bacterium]